MRVKTCPVLIKSTGDPSTDDGIFEAIVSVFGNKDWYGDVVMPGAFADTLAAWEASEDPIPVYWSHRLDDPDFNIGAVLEAAELQPGDERLPSKLRDLGGLWVRAQLDLASPKAAQTWRLLKGRRVTQFSFTYDVVEGASVRSDELGDFFELRRVNLYEVGPTPLGANPETELLAVKDAGVIAERLAAGIKAGRVLSAKNEDEIRAAHDALGRVLASLTPDDEKAGAARASANDPATEEEPPAANSGAKSEEPSHRALASSLVHELSILNLG